MKKVTVTIAAKDYTITLDEDFAVVFEEDLKAHLDDNNSLNIKELLTAFVQKCYENYRQEEAIDNIYLKIAKSIREDKKA